MNVRIALAALAGVATLTAAGVATTAVSASASTTSTTHVVPSPPGCTAGQLSAMLSMSQVKGHNLSFVLTLTNTSHQACTVSGYPGLQLLNSWKQPLSTKTVLVQSTFPALGKIVLLPGRSATATISFTVYGRYFGWNQRGFPFLGAKAAYLQVTLPSTGMPWPWGHSWIPAQHFTLRIPGGPVRIVQNRLSETALMGHMPVHPW